VGSEQLDNLLSLKNCPALVLAGGLGTRLRSAYADGPKCMAPVGGRRFLEYLLLWLRNAGLREVVLCAGHKASQLRNWIGDGSNWEMCVRYSVEHAPLGTAGGLKQAEELITAESFFVLNGDSFLDVDLHEMYRFHLTHRALATMAVVHQQQASRYGTVEMNHQGEIVAFQEKDARVRNDLDGSGLINGGVYLFRRKLLDLIPSGKALSLEREVFPSLTPTNLHGFVTSTYFIDIGIPADLERAQSELPRRFPL
jgi:D-glycero-alpha-D-manno-heptose 1-phosphate guanylyltransferase